LDKPLFRWKKWSGIPDWQPRFTLGCRWLPRFAQSWNF